jgi:hypothetical protein
MYVVFVGKEENVVKTPLKCNLRDTLKDVYSEGTQGGSAIFHSRW